MASLIVWLLQPKNLLIVLLAVCLGLTWLAYDLKKHSLMKCDANLALTEKAVTEGQEKLSAANTIIDGLKKNLAAIKKTVLEMGALREEANRLRQKLYELQDRPLTCPELEMKYEEISIDAAKFFNSGGVRGKIRHPDAPASDSGSGQVLLDTGKASVQGDKP